MLQIGFFLSGSDDERHILVPFGTFIFLFRVSGFSDIWKGVNFGVCIHSKKLKFITGIFFFNCSLAATISARITRLYCCSSLTEVRKHVPFATEHTFADTLLHRELGRLFRLEA